MRMAGYVPGTQPGCEPCSVIFKMSIVVIVWPLGSKTRQTSRIRRDSENWVILGHTPKLPKIIDRNYINIAISYFNMRRMMFTSILCKHLSKFQQDIDVYRSLSYQTGVPTRFRVRHYDTEFVLQSSIQGILSPLRSVWQRFHLVSFSQTIQKQQMWWSKLRWSTTSDSWFYHHSCWFWVSLIS